MGPTRPPEPGSQWLPSGFPPRSFPQGPPPPPAAAVPVARRPRRARWLAVAAILAAVLLLVAGLVLVSRRNDGGRVAAVGTTSSSTDSSVPALETSTSVPATSASIEPVSTTATGPSTTQAGAPSSPGVLEVPSTLSLPRTDATAGASQAPLALRNSGAAPLSYTVQTNAPGLSATPARGTIGPGASANLTVTLDGSKVPAEGPFGATLSFGGTGGAKTVQVQSIVGRPPDISENAGEACTPPSSTCSRQVKLAPTSSAGASPCNTPWLYSVVVKDASPIQRVTATARQNGGNADASLARGGSTEIFLSKPFPPLGPGITLRFAIDAVDQYGFRRVLPEQTIACP